MKRIIILLCTLLFLGPPAVQGANEIRSFNAGATTCFAVVREIDGDIFCPATNVFEVFGTGARTMADYDIAMVSKSGGMWVGVMDTDISAGYYYLITHQQAGVNPVDTDPAIWQEYGYWTGTVWQPNNYKTIEDKIDIIAIDVAGLDGNAMRGTDGVSLVVPDVAGTASVLHGITDGKIDTAKIVIDTIAIDVAGLDGAAMRGTNSANTVVPDVAGTAASLHTTTDGLISGLNDLSAAEVNSEVDDALTEYDGPTDTEMISYFSALNDITVNDILTGIVEGSYTVVQVLRGLASVNMGLVTGGNTTNIVFRDLGDTKNRVDTTVNSVGNRTAITLDLD